MYKFNDWIESLGAEKILIRNTSEVKDEVGLQTIKENNKQFYLKWKKNYRICRRVYQSLFVEVANTFIQYVNTLTPDEIEQLDNDLKANGWEVKSIIKVENSIELLCIFQMLYYYNGRLPLINGFLLVPDGETPSDSEKISLKTYEMFKDTKSHGLVSLQFLLAHKFFFGGDIGLSKDTITELYKNLSYKTLSGGRQVEFDKISDLTTHVNFKMKHSILSNIDDQDRAVKKDNEDVKSTYEFFKKNHLMRKNLRIK